MKAWSHTIKVNFDTIPLSSRYTCTLTLYCTSRNTIKPQRASSYRHHEIAMTPRDRLRSRYVANTSRHETATDTDLQERSPPSCMGKRASDAAPAQGKVTFLWPECSHLTDYVLNRIHLLLQSKYATVLNLLLLYAANSRVHLEFDEGTWHVWFDDTMNTTTCTLREMMIAYDGRYCSW